MKAFEMPKFPNSYHARPYTSCNLASFAIISNLCHPIHFLETVELKSASTDNTVATVNPRGIFFLFKGLRLRVRFKKMLLVLVIGIT